MMNKADTKSEGTKLKSLLQFWKSKDTNSTPSVIAS